MSKVKTLSITRPSLDEMAALLETIDKRHLSALMMSVTTGSKERQEPLPTSTVLKLALVDWMEANRIFPDRLDSLAAVMSQVSGLDKFALRYEKAEAGVDGERHRFLPTVFTVLDYQYVTVTHAATLYDLRGGQTVEELPHHSLTAVTCDLVVLLLRFFDKLGEVRKLPKEHKHAHPERSKPAQRDPRRG